MKIKVVHRSEATNQQLITYPKKEVVDEETQEQHFNPEAESEIPKSSLDNLSLVEPSNPIDSITPSTQMPSASLLGKRKRKPKEMLHQISPIPFRKKRAIADAAGKSVSTNTAEMKSPTIIRAEEFLSSIGNEHPSFMKLLVRSHVGSCFWMGLPVPFCKKHLPRKDTAVILESSESGEEFEIKYIAEKTGLSAGWRKYAAAHKLVEGDVLVYQLVEPTRFKELRCLGQASVKMYVIRANDLKEVDGALSLLNLDAPAKQSDADVTNAHKVKKHQKKALPLTLVQKRKRKPSPSRVLVALEAQSGNDSDEVASEIFEGSRSSGLGLNFNDIKSFEDFHILVNGVCIDSELPEHTRREYYDICCSTNAYLHDRLLQGLHCKLVAGMICEVVDIAGAIRGCKITTPRKEFDKWDKSLKSFELLGMNVAFMRTRLRWLLSLEFDSEGASDTKKYWEAKNELSRAEDEIKDLEIKLVELKQSCGEYGADGEALKSKAESYELMFQAEVNAPW